MLSKTKKDGDSMRGLSDLEILGLTELVKGEYGRAYEYTSGDESELCFKSTLGNELRVNLQDCDLIENRVLLHELGKLAKCQIEQEGIGEGDWNRAAELDMITWYIYDDYKTGNKFFEQVLKEAIQEEFFSDNHLRCTVMLLKKEAEALYFQSYWYDYKIDISGENHNDFVVEACHRYKEEDWKNIGTFDKQTILDKSFYQALEHSEGLLEFHQLREQLKKVIKESVEEVTKQGVELQDGREETKPSGKKSNKILREIER